MRESGRVHGMVEGYRERNRERGREWEVDREGRCVEW